MATTRTLSPRALNRTLLARQLLVRRHRLTVPQALERMAGLQNQYAPSGYIGLWSRLERFPRHRLTTALEKGTVAQATLMRATIHLVSAADFWPMAAGVRRARREWWARVTGEREQATLRRAAAAVESFLEAGPRREAEIVEHLAEIGLSKDAWRGAGLWVDLVRVPPSGTWERRRADLYGLARSSVPIIDVDERRAKEHLVRRYLGGFGPAAVADIASWAGVPAGVVSQVVEEMPLRRFADQDGSRLVDLPRRAIADPELPVPVRFLPTWDAVLLVHARRAGVLPEEYRKTVFSAKNPHSVGTFLVDGSVAGAWRPVGARVDLEPYAPLPRTLRRQVEEEAERLASFIAD